MVPSKVTQGDFDVEQVRKDFPILNRKIREANLIYLDNAATTHKPTCVINRISQFYNEENSNVHRGVHFLSEKATRVYEAARETVRVFLNAESHQEIIFTRGTTESINLVAQSYGRSSLKAGDEIILSAMEHHSNIVPWQMLVDQIGVKIRVIPINDRGEIVMEEYLRMFSGKTRMVSLVHLSNAIGTINDAKDMIKIAHHHHVPVLIDGAQAVAHLKVDVKDLDCDFYCFSGHKIYGPTGIGILYAKRELLEKMPPVQGGGDMISMVTFEKTHYNDLPYRFEAGTPHIAGAIGLAAAIDYVQSLGLEAIAKHEEDLLHHATEIVKDIPGIELIGTAEKKAGILSFVMDHVHAHDLGTILDQSGVAIRVGHHCAMPLMQRFGVPATARASFAVYNTLQEIELFAEALTQAGEMFR